MEVKIKYEISPTEREIYHFRITNGNVIEYTGIGVAYRNDENDIWGDEWSQYYAGKKKKELDEVNKEYREYDGYDYYELPYEFTSKLEKINSKYNPVMNKTNFGKPYYSGSHSSNNPTPKLTESTILQLIKEEVDKLLTNAKLEL